MSDTTRYWIRTTMLILLGVLIAQVMIHYGVFQ